MLKPTLSMSEFTRLFSAQNAEVLKNKRGRFTAFLNKARSKTLFDKPTTLPTWRAWFCHQPPIMDRLQSSYKDCMFEFDEIRKYFKAKGVRFVFVGGDGLTIGRGNHINVNNMDIYLDPDEPPWLIFVHGEHPHFTWHVIHAGHRESSTHIESK